MKSLKPKVKRNIVFMGQKKLGIDCLEYLYKMNNANILAICTARKGAKIWWDKLFVKEFAKKNNIPVIERQDILKYNNIDFIISVQYQYIIEEEILKKAKIAPINLHLAPLPEYKGCNPISHAIINGNEYFGATLHIMNKEVDAGDVIEKRTFKIPDHIIAKDLYELTNATALKIFKDNIRDILNNNFTYKPQDPNIPSQLYPRDSLKDKKVQLDWPIEKIWNFVRGNEFTPFEPAYIEYNGKKIYLRTKL